jgi:hypothetical protein
LITGEFDNEEMRINQKICCKQPDE